MHGHRVVLARTADVGEQALDNATFDLVVLSVDQAQAGSAFAARLRDCPATRELPIIFLVPELSAAETSEWSKHGGVFSVLKPIDSHGLIDLVERALWMPHVAQSKLAAPAAHFVPHCDWIKLSMPQVGSG